MVLRPLLNTAVPGPRSTMVYPWIERLKLLFGNFISIRLVWGKRGEIPWKRGAARGEECGDESSFHDTAIRKGERSANPISYICNKRRFV